MLKVTKAKLFSKGQTFLDEVWGTEPEPEFDGKISPDGVNDSNYEQYEPISIEDPGQIPAPIGAHEQFIPESQQDFVPTPAELPFPEGTEEIEYPNGRTLAYDGMKTKEVISFDYTNRFGQWAGTRHVEPHDIFTAGTGNEILVTWDLDQNDIRAFIIGNIKPYGVRYEGYNFTPKQGLQPKQETKISPSRSY